MPAISSTLGQPVYRYERKYVVEQLVAAQVQMLIHRHPCMFYEPFPPRWVNNFYLDTLDLQNYIANLNGNSERSKVRLRWYGEMLGFLEHPVLELKAKHGLVGTKEHHPFPPFTLQPGFSQATMDALVMDARFPLPVNNLLRCQQIVLLNRYWRRYFLSRDGYFRLTLDSHLTYYRFDRLYNTFTHRQADHRHLVVELKYEPEYDPQANRVTSFLPFNLSRSSKYVQGIERVYF